MPNSKFWFPKLIFVVVLVLSGFYFLSREVVLKSAEQIELVPQVLGQTSTQPLEPLLPPTIPQVQSKSVNEAIADYSFNLPVLMYHYVRGGVSPADELSYGLSVTPEALEQQLAYLDEQGFQTISFADLVESLEQGIPLPPKSVILTFDDGYRDFYTTAFPLLKKYNLRAVNFYVVGYSNYPGYMDWDMVREIHNSGLVDVQSHTLSHLLLTKLTPEEQKREIFDSKQIIENMLGKKVNVLAYPYGDFSDQVVGFVNEAGYKLAFGTQPGPLLKRSERLSLRRVTVSGFDDIDKFIQKLGQPTIVTKPGELIIPPATSPATPSAEPGNQ